VTEDRPEDPHLRTLEVYQRRADDWIDRRSATTDAVVEFTRWLDREGIGARPGRVVDLGCGPGWHLPLLRTAAVALDGTAAMLERVAEMAPASPRVRADLRALPFARGSLDAAWAERSLVHLRRAAVPMALWDLHRALRVGAKVHLGLFEGELEHGQIDGDDVPGRWFSAWPEPLLRAVLGGAGFRLDLLGRHSVGDVDELQVWATRERTLADTVGPGMRLLLVGLNPSLVASDAGVGFHRPGNRAWPALAAAGLATVDRDPVHLLRAHRIGMTDLVKRASPRADEITATEYLAGMDRLDALCSWLSPDAVCIVGLAGWRAAVDRRATTGVQQRRLGGRPVYLMPNPSGVNAHIDVGGLAEHFAAAARLADAHGVPPDSPGAPP